MTTPAASRGRRSVFGTTLVLAGTLAWLVSWFLPVLPREVAIRPADPQGLEVQGSLSGFDAFVCALLSESVSCMTALTNLVMLAALVLGAWKRVPWDNALGIATLACSVLNAMWFTLSRYDAGNFQVGYWAWLVSFVLVGLGLVLSGPKE